MRLRPVRVDCRPADPPQSFNQSGTLYTEVAARRRLGHAAIMTARMASSFSPVIACGRPPIRTAPFGRAQTCNNTFLDQGALVLRQGTEDMEK